MKKSMLVVLLGMLMALFSLSGKALAGQDDLRTFILTNENSMGGTHGLIDLLIAAGHGDDTLAQILRFLYEQPGSNIPLDFVEEVEDNPPGSDVLHSTLSNWTGLNNPVGINADGSTIIGPYYVRNGLFMYGGEDPPFPPSHSDIPSVGRVNFVNAGTSEDYVDSGSSSVYHPDQNYQLIGAAFTPPKALMLSNEFGATGFVGGLFDDLLNAGHGNKTIYEILQLLAAQPGNSIPPEFVAEIGDLPADCEVRTTTLATVGRENSPLAIATNGTLYITPLYGRDVSSKPDIFPGFDSHDFTVPGVTRARANMATDPQYYISDQTYQDIGVVWSPKCLCYVLSNEGPGNLIDKLITAGHGSENLYQVLQFLAADPNSGIPTEFVTQVGNAPAGSDVKTEPLSTFSNFENNPICICADGNAFISSLYGQDHDGSPGFVTGNMSAVGVTGARSTRATDPAHYINAGTGGVGTVEGYIYFAFGFAWAGAEEPVSDDFRTFVLSNELGPEGEGGLIDRLIAAGHGRDNLYEVLQLLAAQPGTGIPADFVTAVGNNDPDTSDVFTAPLSDFAGLNGPVCINADGTLGIRPILGRDYDGKPGYVSNKVHYPGIALANFTMAE